MTTDRDDVEVRLRVLRDGVTRLLRLRDPVARDRLAVELMGDALPALRDARRVAAQDAVGDGMRAVEYARAIGVTQGAVDHLLYRGAGHRREKTT